jgi:hypothetical protein
VHATLAIGVVVRHSSITPYASSRSFLQAGFKVKCPIEIIKRRLEKYNEINKAYM